MEEDRPEGCIRQLVRYESEPGLPVEGYLLRPAKLTGRVPGVVAMHSTTAITIRQPAGVEGDPEDFFGLKLARLGMVAFCPRCFLWQGEGDYLQLVERFRQRHPHSLGMAKMLWDAVRAVDVLENLPEVDAGRIGAVGHSLGAKEALYLAAFDERIKAAVSSEGGIGLKFTNWDAPWYLGEDVKAGRWAREHHELLALIAPRAFLLLGGDSADGDRSWPFIESALPVYRLYGGQPALGLLNHRRGHSVPPDAEQKTNEWLAAYL
ncbi:MAG: dienelactone hydrolase family protein [Pirellulales bacterium]